MLTSRCPSLACFSNSSLLVKIPYMICVLFLVFCIDSLVLNVGAVHKRILSSNWDWDWGWELGMEKVSQEMTV